MPVSTRHRSSTTVNPEKEERNELGVKPQLHDLVKVKRLQGNKPLYFRPEGQFLDAENEMIFFYWQDDLGPYRLSVLYLKTGKWKEMTGFKKIKHPWSPLSRELDVKKAPLPQCRGAANTFCVIKGHRVILLFGGMRSDGTGPSSDLYLICLDAMKWWKIEMPNEVAPRMDAAMTFIDNRLYIFGGRGHESYSIANFDSKVERWTWVVRDKPYPPHIPKFGFSCEVIPVYGRKQILLLPGCLDEALDPVSISLLSIASYSHCTFHTSPTATFLLLMLFCFISLARHSKGTTTCKETSLKRYMASIALSSLAINLLDGRLAIKTEPDEGLPQGMVNACTSVILATWHDDVLGDNNPSDDEDDDSPTHDLPELWLLNLSTTQPSDCCCLELREKLESLEITIACCDALPDKRILLFGSTVENADFFDHCIEISLH